MRSTIRELPIVSTIDHFSKAAPDYDYVTNKCGYNTPHFIFSFHKEYIKVKQTVLDIGCGTGNLSILFHKAGLIVFGLDGSANMLNELNKKERLIWTHEIDFENMEKLSFESELFDHVSSSGLMYFIENPEKLFSEASRVIKPKGIFTFDIYSVIDSTEDNYCICFENGLVYDKPEQKTAIKMYTHNSRIIVEMLERFNFRIVDKIRKDTFSNMTKRQYTYHTVFICEKN